MLANGIVIDGNISKDNTIKVTIPQLFGDQQLDALICYDGKTEFNYKPGTSVIIGFLYHDSGNPIVIGTYEVDAISETAKLNTSSISYQNSIGDRVDAEKEIKSVQKKIEENYVVELGESDIVVPTDTQDLTNGAGFITSSDVSTIVDKNYILNLLTDADEEDF